MYAVRLTMPDGETSLFCDPDDWRKTMTFPTKGEAQDWCKSKGYTGPDSAGGQKWEVVPHG